MLIEIDEKILQKYPHVHIGYLVAQVKVNQVDPLVEELKMRLLKHLHDQGLNATNYVLHPKIAIWRKMYEQDFGVKAKTYRSSIEALLRRVLTGKAVWNICNIVDLYNCCSILTLLPMGGYDLNKIDGNIHIRYAKEGESFLGLGERVNIQVQPNHIVYADQKNVVCWLWNHKDAAVTCIDKETHAVLFFVDGFEHESVLAALELLSTHLEKINCLITKTGILCASSSKVEFHQ